MVEVQQIGSRSVAVATATRSLLILEAQQIDRRFGRSASCPGCGRGPFGAPPRLSPHRSRHLGEVLRSLRGGGHRRADLRCRPFSPIVELFCELTLDVRKHLFVVREHVHLHPNRHRWPVRVHSCIELCSIMICRNQGNPTSEGSIGVEADPSGDNVRKGNEGLGLHLGCGFVQLFHHAAGEVTGKHARHSLEGSIHGYSGAEQPRPQPGFLCKARVPCDARGAASAEGE
mmetsp:Transcript_65568/g.137064  ORF Transcript_65568/g.137064 Transcript_65568/m.137064 type:complete len:230 (-) Transcript_65568:261-950(-)